MSIDTTFARNFAFGGNTAPQGFSSIGLSQNGQNGGSAYGGAIDSVGFLNLTNCTLITNQCIGGKGGDTQHDTSATAGAGGNVGGAAIANTGIFIAKNCTIATNNAIAGADGINQANSAKNGAAGLTVGGNLYRGGTTSTSTLYNTILQHGIGPDNSGTVVDGGFNISSDTSCAFLATSTSLSKTNASLTNTPVLYTNQSFHLRARPADQSRKRRTRPHHQ